MILLIYRCLVRLHPAAFRLQFGEEMLSIFDEASGRLDLVTLLADASISLLRQWLLRSELWKAPAIVVGAFVPLVIGYGSFIPWQSVWRALCSAF